MLAESYLHRLDPFAIQFTETIGLRWYGVAYIAGFFTAWLMFRWMARSRFSTLQAERAGDLVFACVIGVLVGGRLGFGLFYDPTMFITFTSDIPWWEVLAIHRGGMSSHGGTLGVLVVFVFWGRKNGVAPLHLFDIGAVCATPGLFCGRIANFINGELWGKRLPPELQEPPPWWSIKYPSELTEVWLSSPGSHVEELNAVDALKTTVIGSDSFYQNIVSEMYAGNGVVTQSVKPLLTAWYPSQIFQSLAEGPILLLALVVLWWRPRNPGVISGWFLVLYGLMRICTEAYRQPDVGVEIVAGLSRGQLLSVFMIAVGGVIITTCVKRETEKLGGFSRTTRS